MSSPGSPIGTSFVPSFTSISLTRVFGKGIPTEPTFFFPLKGFMVMPGLDSVIPYPSTTLFFPTTASKALMDSTENGAAPEMQFLQLKKSID